ncbi:MAG: tetratricopeptide repeat protein [Planctomycetota bacterium]
MVALMNRIRPWLILAVVITLAAPAGGSADEYDDVRQLEDRFWEHYNASHYPQAEKTARQMIDIGTRHWNDDQDLITYGFRCLGQVYLAHGNLSGAEKVFKQLADIRETALGKDSGMYGDALAGLAWVLYRQGRYPESERLYKQALDIMRGEWGDDDEDVARVGTDYADLLMEQGRYPEAEQLYSKAIEVHKSLYGENAAELLPYLGGLAGIYRDQDRYADAEKIYLGALDIAENERGKNHVETAEVLVALTRVHGDLGRHAEATHSGERALKILEQAVGKDHLDLTDCLDALAYCYSNEGRFAEAERAARRALAIDEKTLGPVHLNVAHALATLGSIYLTQTRYLEAETVLSRAVSIQEKILPPNSNLLASTWMDLAIVYANQGRYAESEALLKQSQRASENALGKESSFVANAMLVRGQIYAIQNRYDEAEKLLLDSLAMFQSIHGEIHRTSGYVTERIATLYHLQDRNKEAEEHALRAVEITKKALGENDPAMSDVVLTLASVTAALGRYDEAKPLFERSLELVEKTYGPENVSLGYVLMSQAEALHELGRGMEAEPLLNRVIALYERGGLSPADRAEAYYIRAQIAWDDGRRGEALADLRRALDLAEEQRGRVSGAERERAGMFAGFLEGFEKMVEWQLEAGDVSEALAAIERSKARSLLDELTRPGIDLELGRSSLEREQLRQRENEIKSRIAGLEKQLDLVGHELEAGHADDTRRQKLQDELAAAREELYRHYRDARSSSPVYRNLLTVGAGPPRLSQIRHRLVGDNALLLVYMVGKNGGYLVSISPKDAKLSRLAIDEEAGRVLGASAGPLTAERLQTILMNDSRTGVLQVLSSPLSQEDVSKRLHALWTILVPEDARRALTGGEVGRLIVVPDGPLSLLPFETLVVAPGDDDRYLLDVGPPILYGPSASVLFNLDARVAAHGRAASEPVLTVGDPVYPESEGTLVAQRSQHATEQLQARSRYGNAGGTLSRLPNSGMESHWVAEVFEQQEIPVVELLTSSATESNVRDHASGRQWLHLACHGLVDQAHGNFFGALALSPGPAGPANPADDGFLTLAEICELDLAGCELAILSACETNYGPEQRGEGVWGLSRGFLVAGARRVVASNWLVDDEAAASLVSYFCSGVARGQKAGEPDYAQALQKAKRWIRNQQKWQSPYYWGTFVLLGPD